MLTLWCLCRAARPAGQRSEHRKKGQAPPTHPSATVRWHQAIRRYSPFVTAGSHLLSHKTHIVWPNNVTQPEKNAFASFEAMVGFDKCEANWLLAACEAHPSGKWRCLVESRAHICVQSGFGSVVHVCAHPPPLDF